MAGRKILLVEGNDDDEHVFRHICGTRGLPTLDEIVPHGSDTQLLESIPVRLRVANEEGDAIGIVIDADTDAAARWHSLHGIFDEAGYQDLPAVPAPDGTMLKPPIGSFLPMVGVWIMPDNNTDGKLEDFLRFLVPPGVLFDYVTETVEAIPERRFSLNDKPKAVIHTWLAWQENPGRPYGTAITARFLDSNVPQVDALVAWLERLFFHSP